MKILVLNCGSSSIKSCLYIFKDQRLTPAWEYTKEWDIHSKDSLNQILSEMIESLLQNNNGNLQSLSEIDCIGHRIVHGGKEYRESVLINQSVKETIRQFAQYAPLHNIPALYGIEMMEKLLKQRPQIAVFDTAFHHTLPLEASIYPVPYRWYENKIQRYGFHGISYQYCASQASHLIQKDLRKIKMVICHLGAGASLCAVKDGKSHDTTMGFTPLEGLMMNTRSGTIDPGIILEQLKNTDIDTLTNELYRESGLLGISGVSGDMRDILQYAKKGHLRAQLAFDIYIHRLCSCIGSMIAAIGGLDVLVFTAGIGEYTPLLRKKVSDRFAFLGIKIDEVKNEGALGKDEEISQKNSNVSILVIHTQEALEIARECQKIIQKKNLSQ